MDEGIIVINLKKKKKKENHFSRSIFKGTIIWRSVQNHYDIEKKGKYIFFNLNVSENFSPEMASERNILGGSYKMH